MKGGTPDNQKETRAPTHKVRGVARSMIPDDEIAASNADFKTILDNVKGFRNEGYLWWQVAEYTYDTFMIRNRSRG